MLLGFVLARALSGNYSMDIFRDFGVSQKFFNVQSVSFIHRLLLIFVFFVFCAVLSV